MLISAKVVVELAKSDFIQSAVLLHPSLVTVDDMKGSSYLHWLIFIISCNVCLKFWVQLIFCNFLLIEPRLIKFRICLVAKILSIFFFFGFRLLKVIF